MNGKIEPTGDNGEMTEKEQAIREGKTCGECAMKFPSHHPLLIVEIKPPPGKIIPANAKMAVALCICQNPKSDEFQRVVNVFCGCKHCQKVENANNESVNLLRGQHG